MDYQLREFETLPVGVTLVDRALILPDVVLCKCEHDPQFQHPSDDWAVCNPCAWPGEETTYFAKELSSREVREQMEPGQVLDYCGWLVCSVCGLDENATDSFQIPGFMLARVGDA